MPWAKIDDRLFLSPKWLMTPPAARGLWVTALSYCALQMTGGKVSSAVLPLLGGTPDDAAALVASGLWEHDGEDFRIHDYHEWNPTKEEMQAKRAAISEVRAEAGRRSGQARRNGLGNHRNYSDTNNEQNVNKREQKPNPVPVSHNPDCLSVDKQSSSPTPSAESVPPCGSPFPLTTTEIERIQKMDPDAVLTWFRSTYPDQEDFLSAKLAASSGPVRSQAAYLRPAILKRISGDEAKPVAVSVPKPGVRTRLTATEERIAEGEALIQARAEREIAQLESL